MPPPVPSPVIPENRIPQSLLLGGFDFPQLRADLTFDEGSRRKPYVDTLGNVSIGIGRNLTDVGISPDEVSYLFTNDVITACSDLDLLMPWWRSLPASHQRIMVNLAFNMGAAKLRTFPVFLAAMKDGRWGAAGDALRDSRWFDQVGGRGPRMIQRLSVVSA